MSADVYYGNSLSQKVIDGQKHHCIRCGGDGTSDDDAAVCSITNEICVPQCEYDEFPLGACNNGLPRWELDRKNRMPAKKQASARGKPPRKKGAGTGAQQEYARNNAATKQTKPPAKKKRS